MGPKDYIWLPVKSISVVIPETKNKACFLLFCFLYSCLFLCGAESKLDSLYKAFETTSSDTEKVNTLNAISRQLFVTSQFDSALSYAVKADKLSEQCGFKKGQASAWINIGNVKLTLGQRDEALKHYEDALKLQKSLPPESQVKKGMASSYSNIGNVYNYRGDYDQAMKYYKLALFLRLEIKDMQGIAICYTNIATLYFLQGNYPEALRNNFLALEIESRAGDKIAIARTYNNTGNIFVQQQNYSEALKNYMNAMQIQKEIGDKHGLGRAYNNIGTVYFMQKDYTNALNAFLAGLAIKRELGDQGGIGHALVNLGLIHFIMAITPGISPEEQEAYFDSTEADFAEALKVLEKIGDAAGISQVYNNTGSLLVSRHRIKEAMEFLEKGLALSLQVNNKEEVLNAYRALSMADSASGDWKAAYEHHKLFRLYKDSLLNEENSKKIVQLQMNYEFHQKEEKNKLIYEESLKRQKLIGWSVAGFLVFILLVTFLLFNRARLRQKNEHQQQLNKQQKLQADAVMEIQEQERKRIAEDLHDSLGHLLSTAKLNLQALPEDQRLLCAPTLQLLDQASSEMRDISFNLMPQTLEEEGLIPALYELADKIKKSSLYDIIVQVHDMHQIELDKQTKFNIYRIVQEAVNNILKHANAKEINIQLIKQDDHLSIMIEDDGKGFDTALTKKGGRGLRNITARSEWLHGSITIDSTPGKGTTISIVIPITFKA
jgi:signal transduction histidine kinase/Tfp pilus assembly protein PilF